MLDRDRLGDHSAHRGADDMGGLDLEVIHQADGVGGNVAQPVGGLAEAKQHRRRARNRRVDLLERPMSRLSKRITR